MKALCIDMGNTRTHCAITEDYKILKNVDLATENFSESFNNLKELLGSYDCVSWCSVVPREANKLRALLESLAIKSYELNYKTYPLGIDLKNKEEVGGDRLADALGAMTFFKAPFISIDMGTAITVDFVDENYNYAGGAISPGLQAFTKYLHEKTALLPLLDSMQVDWDMNVGKNTLECMQVGCVKGLCYMIDAIVADIAKDYFKNGDISTKTIFTGGSLSLLPKKWLANRRIECHLAILGLYKFMDLQNK